MSSNSNFVTSLGKIQIHLQQVLLLLSNMQYVYRNIKSTRRHTRITTTNRMWISVWQTIPWDKVNVVRTKRNIQDPRSVTRQRSYQVALHTANTHNMQPFISSSFHVQTTQATGVWGRLLVSKNQASMSITRQSDGGWREEGQWVTSLVGFSSWVSFSAVTQGRISEKTRLRILFQTSKERKLANTRSHKNGY